MTAIAGHMIDYHEQVDMAEVVRRAFSNFANVQGRANRGGFWWFSLATTLVNIVLTMVDSAMWSLPILSLLWSLVLFIPGLSLTVGRFRTSASRAGPSPSF